MHHDLSTVFCKATQAPFLFGTSRSNSKVSQLSVSTQGGTCWNETFLLVYNVCTAHKSSIKWLHTFLIMHEITVFNTRCNCFTIHHCMQRNPMTGYCSHFSIHSSSRFHCTLYDETSPWTPKKLQCELCNCFTMCLQHLSMPLCNKNYQSVQQNLTMCRRSCFLKPINPCNKTSPYAMAVVFQYLSICAKKPHHVPLQLFFITCQSVQQNLTMCHCSCFSIPVNLCNKTSPCVIAVVFQYLSICATKPHHVQPWYNP